MVINTMIRGIQYFLSNFSRVLVYTLFKDFNIEFCEIFLALIKSITGRTRQKPTTKGCKVLCLKSIATSKVSHHFGFTSRNMSGNRSRYLWHCIMGVRRFSHFRSPSFFFKNIGKFYDRNIISQR